MADGWQVGVDIGGTFTDVVAWYPASGEVRSAKVATCLEDRVAGLLSALRAVRLDWWDVADLVHGTTMVTNAIIENDLADVALVATAGFSDTLAIGRQNRRHLYRLDLPPKSVCQVPESRRFEVAERLDHDGRVLEPLNGASVDAAIEGIAASGVKAVAVSLLHSYADPAHEEELGERLRARFPFVALSNRVNPEAREYERTATTALSAGVMPLAAGYLDRLEAAKPSGSRLHLFHSAGGMASSAAMRDLPLGLALSGPAAGVAAAGRIARALRIGQALSFDMGGTTTDVCLIIGGRAQVSSDRSLADRPLRQPMVAVESIGAGGGSIARLEDGALLVGPESAGADPGPVCYGRGGTLPTVSDANLVLGYLDETRVLGGELRLDAEAARAALAPLAQAMDMTVDETALGIVRVANSAMVRALRRVTVEQGIDGRQCALIAFGGAGPMHAVGVAREFGVSRLVVPGLSGVFSALGCISADVSYTRQQTVHMTSLAWDSGRLDAIRHALRERLLEHLSPTLENADLESGRIAIAEVAAVRYRGQSYAIEVHDPAFDDPGRLGDAFRRLHEKLYGFASAEPWELVSVRMTASVPRGAILDEPAPAGGGAGAKPFRVAPCIFGGSGPLDTPRFERSALLPGQRIAGPLVVEDAYSTVIVPPEASLTPDESGNLLIDAGGAV